MSKLMHIAIIGAGPAGYYAAEALTKNRDDIRVDIIDRLPTPFGLIRAGVAPDHQSIKKVALRYEKTSTQDCVRFVGNLTLGKDITVDELRTLYDVVLLSTGAEKDRSLGIKGENLDGVYGSGAFVGWYNSHPDFKDLNPNLNITSAVVIGNGNVAVDVVRILAKTSKEMANTDLAHYAADVLHTSPLRDIYMIGRRGPMEASFTPKELGELNALDNCVALVDEHDLPDCELELTSLQNKNMKILREMAKNDPVEKPVRLHIKFFRKPDEIISPDEIGGKDQVSALKLEKTTVEDGRVHNTGVFETLPTGLIVTSIGYRSSPIPGIPFDEQKGRFHNTDGKIEDGLYCTGWARRGPTGTIGTNKPDAAFIAEKILNEIAPAGKPGRNGLEELIKARGLDIVTFKDWKRIEEFEESHGENGSPRLKLTDIDEMVKVAHSAPE